MTHNIFTGKRGDTAKDDMHLRTTVDYLKVISLMTICISVTSTFANMVACYFGEQGRRAGIKETITFLFNY